MRSSDKEFLRDRYGPDWPNGIPRIRVIPGRLYNTIIDPGFMGSGSHIHDFECIICGDIVPPIDSICKLHILNCYKKHFGYTLNKERFEESSKIWFLQELTLRKEHRIDKSRSI